MPTLWARMDRRHLWHWVCTDDDGNTIAQSAQSYFNLADATAAMKRFSQSFKKP